MLEEVIFTENNGVGIITLNRPDRLNALTYQMVQKINQNINLWEVKEEINCVIIEGAGDRSFCAGGLQPTTKHHIAISIRQGSGGFRLAVTSFAVVAHSSCAVANQLTLS